MDTITVLTATDTMPQLLKDSAFFFNTFNVQLLK